MNKQQILARLDELNFDKTQYWVITGGAMALYGLRAETGDIDLGCTTAMAEALIAQGYPVTTTSRGYRKIAIGEDVEIIEGWLIDRVVDVDGVPVISLRGLRAMKESLGREKDLRDIALIDAYIAGHPDAR